MQAAARIQQNGVRRRCFQRRHVGKADCIVIALACQLPGGKHGDGDIPHTHHAGNALGAVGQGGGDGALAAVGPGADGAVFIHRGHVFVAALPVDFLPAVLFRSLVGGQGGAGILGIQMQLQLIGIVDKGRVCRLADTVGNPGDGKGTHDKVQVHRLALYTVVCAGGHVGALPHIVSAGVAQRIREAGDPQIVAPGVECRVTEAGAHPVQRGIDALLPGIAQFYQAVKECLGDGNHLLGEDTADALVLQIVVNRVGQLVGRGGVILQSFLGRGYKAQQAGHMVCLGPCFFHRRRIRIQVHTEGNPQPGTLIGVAAPLVVVLGPVGLLAIPLAAVTAADDGEIDTGGLGLFPVHFALEFGNVHALEHGRRDGLPAGVEIIPQIIFLPGCGRCTEIRLGRAGNARRTPGQHDAHCHHNQQAQQTKRQHHPAAPTAAALAPAFAAARRLGTPGRGRRNGSSRSILSGPRRAAIYFAIFSHGNKPLLAQDMQQNPNNISKNIV